MKNIIYAHEHLTIDFAGPKNDLDCRLDDPAAAMEDLHKLPDLGVAAVVDQTNRGMGRSPLYAQKLADRLGISLLHATGYYKEPFLPQECYLLSENELCDIMLAELRDEISGTGLRASLIGEIGTSKDAVMPVEEKIFRASSRAHVETGAPICTHTTLGRLGMEQVSIFKHYSVDLGKVVISHADLSGDADYMLNLLEEGVNIAFDTVGKTNYQPDDLRALWLAEFCKRGYSSQIVLSMDITRKSHYKANGGPGYVYLLETFLPMLREKGCKEEHIEEMLEKNPARIYGIKAD